MAETRVNLKHLLEDIRDSYPYPLEEAIITELIANSLDSKASEIKFITNPESKTFTILDNGKGMKQKDLVTYHDIAASTKARGKGIGFAGIGGKLALLIADSVITETKSPGFHKATTWKLENFQKAPWRYLKSPGLVKSRHGTAVSIILRNPGSPLLSHQSLQTAIMTHFYPLLDKELMTNILKYIYLNGIKFFINQERMESAPSLESKKTFTVKLGRKTGPVGFGFIRQTERELPESERGLAISTYGKIIKRGWDWLGILPNNPWSLTGVVEVPSLAENLITNKADFQREDASLRKFYRYRKAIQTALDPILQNLGALCPPHQKPNRELRFLEKEMEKVLGKMLSDFPELSPLLASKAKAEAITRVIADPQAELPVTGLAARTGQGELGEENPEPPPAVQESEPRNQPVLSGQPQPGRHKPAGLMIGFDSAPQRTELGWLMENTLWINRGHPAYEKAVGQKAENYHIVITIAWVLSGYLQEEKSPQQFINLFLAHWGLGL